VAPGHGGLKVDQACRIKELEPGDARLERLVAALAPNKAILQGASKLADYSRTAITPPHRRTISLRPARSACRGAYEYRRQRSCYPDAPPCPPPFSFTFTPFARFWECCASVDDNGHSFAGADTRCIWRI